MTDEQADATRVLVPTGALGSGVRADEVEAGMALNPHAIALDAGSTDSGPAYLATGKSKYSRQAVKRDLSILMAARERAGIPLLIGSCGTSGCDEALDWTLDTVLEVAREQGTAPRIALLCSEQDKAVLKAKALAGAIRPLAPAEPLDEATIDACAHIVALLGPEPYIAALDQGADIILGGRTTDTAVLAAAPLRRGQDAGAAWHAAKIAECGGLCTLNPSNPGVMMSVDRQGFSISPLAAANRCTPETVSAHMLYENSDPFRLVEPGGVLDVTEARYVQADARTV
ncbi:MAG TPA: acyclic terpene utilization AtuA family protein, partial [Caulobacteraceae bacterium]